MPKKKKSRKREASTDEGMPPPPPPIPTIRLEYKLNPEGEDSEFNVLEAAQALGLIPNWASNEEPEPDAVEAAEPVDAGSALLPGMDSLSPEEIARRIDEQHAAQERAKASSKKKKVVKRVSFSRFRQRQPSDHARSRMCMMSRTTLSTTRIWPLTMPKRIFQDRPKRASLSTQVLSRS